MDGNLGVVAAMMELLIQSHKPNTLHLLPALPTVMKKNAVGKLWGVRVRGGVHVSFAWELGNVTGLELNLEKPHPWLYGLTEVFDTGSGFFTSRRTADEMQQQERRNEKGKPHNQKSFLRLVTPNELVISSTASSESISTSTSSSASTSSCASASTTSKEKDSMMYSLTIVLHSFPCQILLCSVDSKQPQSCQEKLQ